MYTLKLKPKLPYSDTHNLFCWLIKYLFNKTPKVAQDRYLIEKKHTNGCAEKKNLHEIRVENMQK